MKKLTSEEFVQILSRINRGMGNTTAFSYSENAVVFENILVEDNLIIKIDLLVDFDIFFVSCEFKGEVKITNCTLKKTLRIQNSLFHKAVSFQDNNIDTLTIANSEFRNDFCVFSGSFDRLVIESAIFNEHLKIFDGSFKDQFDINGGTFYKHVHIYNGSFNSEVSINGGEFQNITIENGTFSKTIWITKGNIKGPLSIRGGSFDRVFIESTGGLEMHSIILSFKQNPIKLVKLKNLNLNSIIFKDTILSKDAIVQLEKITVNQLTFSSMLNYGNINLTRVVGKSRVSITNTDMGKTVVIDSSLEDFFFFSSKITDIFMSNTKIPSNLNFADIKKRKYELNHLKTYWEQQRLAFGQLKKVYAGSGDVVTSNTFFALEMNCYYRSLSYKSNFWEKSNLLFNQISSNHGESWKKGLVTTLLCSTIFYISYCWFLGYNKFDASRQGWENLYLLSSFFPEFISPIHKADYIPNELKVKLTSESRIIEAVSRIFITYFLYQLIQAFRKHGKK